MEAVVWKLGGNPLYMCIVTIMALRKLTLKHQAQWLHFTSEILLFG